MLNEVELRTESHRPDFAVTLNDGQVWHLPSPVIRMLPVRGTDGKPGFKDTSRLGPEYIDRVHAYQRAITDWQAAPDGDTQCFDAYIACQLDLAIALLQANYRLDYDQAAELIAIDLADENQADQLVRIGRLAQGVSPKRLAVGSSPDSESTA